jgi:hypothetical protein
MGGSRDVRWRPLFDLGATKAFEDSCRDRALCDREVRLRLHPLEFVLISTFRDTVPLLVVEEAYVLAVGANGITLSRRLGVVS